MMIFSFENFTKFSKQAYNQGKWNKLDVYRAYSIEISDLLIFTN